MEDQISNLRTAGFNDEEISTWTTEKRTSLAAAGFKDNEIDAFFTGGVTVPENVPDALIRRVDQGEEARKREGGLMQTIPQFAHMVGTPEGRSQLWEAVKKYPAQFAESMVDQLKVPGEVEKGNIDINTPEGMDQAVGLGMLVGLGRLNKLTATGKTSGLSVAMGEPVARITRGPTGEIVDVPVGGLPNSSDFVSAARTIGGDAKMATQEKMLTLYEEKGIHPAEVAADAATDPIVQQRILSSDPKDMPYGYHGSPVPFTEFDPAKAPYYFTPDPKVAGEYAASTYNEGWAAFQGKAVVEDAGKQPHIVPAQLDMQRPYTADMWDFKEAAKARDPEWLRKNGYDSAILKDAKDPTATEYLVLDREQIRSPYAAAAGRGGKPPEPPKPPKAPEPGSFEEAQQKVLDKVSVGDREQRSMSWSKLYTETIDDLHPIKAVSEDAYQAARLTRGQFGKAEHFIEQGTFDFNTLKTNGKPLKEVLEPVRNDLDGLRAYLTSKRAIEIEATERKSGIDMAAAQQVVSEGAAKYEKVAGEIVDYQNKTLQYLKDSGVVSDDAFKAMTEANKNYVPFYRVFAADEGGGVGKGFGPGNPLKKLKGSDRGIIDPLESIIKNTYAYVSIAERNAVGVKIIDALQEQGLKAETKAPKATGAEADLIDYLKQSGVTEAEKLVDFVKASASDDGTAISAWRDGERISVETGDAELVRAFRGLDQQSTGLLTKVFAVPAKTLRAGSVLTPDFMARNVARDFMTAFVNSKGLFSPIDTFKGAKSAITKDNVYSDWVKSGGANATMVALDRRYMQESLTKLTADTGLGTRAWNVVTSPLAGLRMASEMLENATRLGEYRKALGDTIKRRENAEFLEPSPGAAFHGSAVHFEKFDLGKVRTGSGMTLHGKGVYLTEDAGMAKSYTPKGGATYKVKVAPDESRFIDQTKPMDQQSPFVRDAMEGLSGTDRQLPSALSERGIAGTIYKETEAAHRNFVVFKDSDIQITHKNGKPIEGAGVATKEDMQSAAYASREVTLDFARIGAKMRAYNMVTAFANAQIQGMDRIVRGFVDRPVNTSLKVVGGITLPSVLLWYANHGDPRYEELPDWQKDLFWIVPTDKWEPISATDAASKPDHLLRQEGGQWQVNNGHIWRIPKPFELGVIFGSGAERALSATIGKDKEAFEGFTKSVMQVLTPSFTPTAVQPVIEQWANRSSFTDRTLIPADLEKQLPEYQYTPYTTELSKALGKMVAAVPGVREASVEPGATAGPAARSLSSPILIENYIRSWTGGLGMYGVQLADYALRKAGELPDPVTPTPTLADIPFVRAFAVRYPSATTESIQKFYDEHERDKRFFDTWMAKAQEGDAVAMERIQAAGGPRVFVRLDAIKETLSEHSKLVRDIYKNPDVPAEEKRQLIDGLYYSMIEIGKAGRTMLKQAKETMVTGDPALAE